MQATCSALLVQHAELESVIAGCCTGATCRTQARALQRYDRAAAARPTLALRLPFRAASSSSVGWGGGLKALLRYTTVQRPACTCFMLDNAYSTE